MMVMTEAKVLAGASASGHFQVEVMEVLAEHWEIKWWPFSSFSVTGIISVSFFLRKNANCWRLCTRSSSPC